MGYGDLRVRIELLAIYGIEWGGLGWLGRGMW